MREQGLSEASALKAAQERIALEEKANAPRRRGLLDADASALARRERRSAADRARDERLGRDGEAQADRLARLDRERRRNFINPERAAAALARANGAADPGRVEREKRQEDKARAEDPTFRVVKSIEDKFSKLASA
jgi:hypothetical protein